MIHQVALSKTAEHDLGRLDNIWQRSIAKHLQKLAADPRLSGVTKLRGTENEWRIRVGDYRIIYEMMMSA